MRRLTSDYFARSFQITAWTLETEPLQGGIDYGGTTHGHSGFILPATEVARMREEVAIMVLAGLGVSRSVHLFAVTIILAPPGQPVANFVGAVTKEQIVAKIQAGPCADGKCGPNGCCPK